MPHQGGVQPPGKAMTMGQHMVDKGAAMMQSLKPIKMMSQHVCTFALYAHDMGRQIITHHFISRLNQDFLQCAVYDSDDSSARLIGIVLLLSHHHIYKKKKKKKKHFFEIIKTRFFFLPNEHA